MTRPVFCYCRGEGGYIRKTAKDLRVGLDQPVIQMGQKLIAVITAKDTQNPFDFRALKMLHEDR